MPETELSNYMYNIYFSLFSVLRVKVNSKSNVERQLFVKPHSAREVDAYRPKERTLFVLNIPPYIDKVG